MALSRPGIFKTGASTAALCASVLGLAHPAYALTDYVVPAGTTDTAAKSINGTDTVTVQNTGTLQTTTSPSIQWTGGNSGDVAVVINSGTIRSTQAGGTAIYGSVPIPPGAFFNSKNERLRITNNAGGVIEAQGDVIATPNSFVTVINAGRIQSTLGGSAINLVTYDRSTNAPILGAASSITNLAGGELLSAGGVAVRLSTPSIGCYPVARCMTALTNEGTISSTAVGESTPEAVNLFNAVLYNKAGASISGAGDGVVFGQSTSQLTGSSSYDIENLGSIVGTQGIGIRFIGNFANRVLLASGSVTTGGNGIAIDLGGGNDTITIENQAIVNGAVQGGDGDDTIAVHAGATLNGLLDGGAGEDTLSVTNSGVERTFDLAKAVNFETALATGPLRFSGMINFAYGLTANNGVIIIPANLSAPSIVAGTYTVETASDAITAARLTGQLTKTGAGTLTLDGQFLNKITVDQGTFLSTTVASASDITTQAGATLAGTAASVVAYTRDGSQPGNLFINNSGTLSQRSSSGTVLTVNVNSNASYTATISNYSGGLIESAGAGLKINYNATAGNGRVTINNTGTIRTAGDAIDLSGSTGSAVAFALQNRGEIRSTGGDAIKLAANMVSFTNAQGSSIIADGTTTTQGNAINFAGYSASFSDAGGTIYGYRDAITGGNVMTLDLAGTRVTAQTGNGISGNVVNVIGDATISALSGYGIRASSGDIRLFSASTIDSGLGGILIDDGAGGAASGTSYISVGGPVRVTNGPAIRLVGNFNDVVTVADVLSGGGGVPVVDLGGGDDIMSVWQSSRISGTIDGGAGYDVLQLTKGLPSNTPYSVIAPDFINFEQLDVQSGIWTVRTPSPFTGQTFVRAAAQLTTNLSSLGGGVDVAAGGSFTIDDTASGTFSGPLTGTGTFTKTGSGALNMGTQAFQGTMRVDGGTVNFNGRMPSQVVVGAGLFSPNGQIAGLTVENGGRVDPGSSFGTLYIDGDFTPFGGPNLGAGSFTQRAGSTYSVQIDASGASDRIVVAGTATIENGAQLLVGGNDGFYAISTRYLLLDASGGLSGAYSSVGNNLPSHLTLSLFYTPTSLYADVTRSSTGMTAVAATPLQLGIGSILSTTWDSGSNMRSPAYDALRNVRILLSYTPSDDAVRASYNSLGGVAHIYARASAIDEARGIEDLIASHATHNGNRSGERSWGFQFGGLGQRLVPSQLAQGGAITGSILGTEFPVGRARLGMAIAKTHNRSAISNSANRSQSAGSHVFGYAMVPVGPVDLVASAGYSATMLGLGRTIDLPGVSFGARSNYLARISRISLEASMPIGSAGALRPYVRLTGSRMATDGFVERGSPFALQSSGGSTTFATAELGIRAETTITQGLALRAMAALQSQSAFGDSGELLAFAGGEQFRSSTGLLARDTGVFSANLDWTAQPGLKLSLGYDGRIGNYNRHKVEARVAIAF